MNQQRCYSYLRFSSPEQATGDSIRRQTALAEKWAEKHGVVLDDSLKMEDHGLSGFHKKNVDKNAALGKFLTAIKDGKVPRGSVLLVESMDRLSRASVKDAQVLFMQILQAGVDIVTLADEKRYSWETLDELQLILSIFLQSRAHEESLAKSRRISSVWSAKHQRARETKKPITRRIPAWIRLDDSGIFQVIEERAILIRRIFREALNGDGVDLIARRFNQEGIPPWGVSHKRNRDKATPVWNKSYVFKILNNGAVYGLYVPSVLVDGKRTPQEAIEDFYPAIINKTTFLQTREAMSSRTLGAGRTGRVSNLFPYLVKCGYCGENAHHVNKGKGKKTGQHGGEYFACSLARVGKGCEYHGLPYSPFEHAFLQYCSEVDLSALLAQDSRAEAIAQAQGDLDTVAGALKAAEGKITGLLATISAVTNPVMAERLAKELDHAGEEQERLTKEREAATLRLEGLQSTGQTVADHVDAIREISANLEGTNEEERIAIRKRLKHAVARAVERITIYPNGLRDQIVAWDPATGITIKPFRRDHADQVTELALLDEHVAQNTGRDKACVLVRFKNGHSRLFRWSVDEKFFVVSSEETVDRLVIGGREF